MLRSFALTVALGAGASCACSFLHSTVQFDTLSPGVVRAVESTERTNIMTNQPEWRHDTLGVYYLTDFRAHLQANLNDSALVFIGRVDTMMMYDSAFPPSPLIVLGPPDSYLSYPFFARISVDTLIKGTLPGKVFWVKAWTPGHSCATSWRVGRTFLNVSNKLENTSDIKQPTSDPGPRGYYIATAQWIDGRYVVSPEFPGLKLDITEVLPGYTVAVRPGRPEGRVPLRAPGKAYRLDGREVPEADRRTSPVPLVR